MSIETESQKLESNDAVIELYVIDGTGIPGGSVYRFTPDSIALFYGGNEYTPFPIGFQGAEQTATGTQPRPTLSVSNVFGTLLSDLIMNDDLCNYKVTRIRTLRSHLDDGTDPDDTAHWPLDVYFVENLLTMTNKVITWQLSSPLERLGTMLPRRQATKDPSPLTPRGFPGMSRSRQS